MSYEKKTFERFLNIFTKINLKCAENVMKSGISTQNHKNIMSTGKTVD